MIRDGEVHVEQEVFMASFACNDEADYGSKPDMQISHSSRLSTWLGFPV